MIEYQVGDLVIVPFGQGFWPGKITQLDVMADVKLFKMKKNIKISLSDLLPYNKETITDIIAVPNAANDKALMNALKMAEKHKAEDQNKVVVSITPPVRQVKQEQDNNRCKEEQEEEQRESLLPRYESAYDFIMSLDEKPLLQQCRQNKTSLLSFFNTATNSIEKVVKKPKMFVAVFFQKYLIEIQICQKQEKYKQDKTHLHRKIANIINNNVIDLEVLLRTRVQHCMLRCINNYRQKGGDKAIEKTVNLLLNLQKQLKQQLSNYLEDYTSIALQQKAISQLWK